jgi:hypothetical protein
VAREGILPDLGLVVTAVGIVVLAVVLWTVASLVRGEVVQPLEAVMFAVVFGLVYFGSLSVLGGDQDDRDGESS